MYVVASIYYIVDAPYKTHFGSSIDSYNPINLIGSEKRNKNFFFNISN